MTRGAENEEGIGQMAIRKADRVRELYYSYGQATRNWLTTNDRRSRPDGLIELGVLLGDGLRSSIQSKAGDLATAIREEFLRIWIQSTAKLLDAIEPASAEFTSMSPKPSDQRRLAELFHLLQNQIISHDGPHYPQPHDAIAKHQLVLAEEADSP